MRTLQKNDYGAVFRDRNLAVILLLGFSSGLPIALVGSTLQAWMTVEGVNLATIGLITLVGVPYTWKFLWAPTMDRFVPPFLGRRRGWLVVTQGAIIAGLAAMAFCSPKTEIVLLASLALFVAFMSASQDIAVDAYRTDIATSEQRGIVAALNVLGYRLAMLTSGALALVLAAGSGWIGGLGWQSTYLVMAGLMGIGVINEPVEWLLFSDFSVVLAFVHLYTMFMIVPIFNSMMRIDRSLLEAASDGGANGWQTLWNVIVPLSKTGIIIGSIFVITIVMGDFVTIGVMGGQQIASIGKIIQVQTSYLQFPLAAANAVILLAIVLMIIWGLTRLVDIRKEL